MLVRSGEILYFHRLSNRSGTLNKKQLTVERVVTLALGTQQTTPNKHNKHRNMCKKLIPLSISNIKFS